MCTLVIYKRGTRFVRSLKTTRRVQHQTGFLVERIRDHVQDFGSRSGLAAGLQKAAVLLVGVVSGEANSEYAGTVSTYSGSTDARARLVLVDDEKAQVSEGRGCRDWVG